MADSSEVVLCECAARDGLQHESAILPTDRKVELIDLFSCLGFPRIEVTSFSHPKYVPQFSDAEEVLRRIHRRPGVHYKATCVNSVAVRRALVCLDKGHGPTEISTVVSASEAHSRKNVGKNHNDVRADLEQVLGPATESGLRVVGTIGTAFGCPYTGEVTLDQIVPWVEFFLNHSVQLITLGDTTGMANPVQVEARVSELVRLYPDVTWIGHFHDTRGCGIANALAAVRAGATHLDAAFGGLGGHPAAIKYARGHTGNVATEDLVAVLEEMGIKTGIRTDRLVDAALTVEATLGRELYGRVTRAGLVRDLLPVDSLKAE